MNSNAEYIRSIVEENFTNSGLGTEMTLQEYVAVELEQYPEGFDCFFEKSWDELSEGGRNTRVRYITDLFN